MAKKRTVPASAQNDSPENQVSAQRRWVRLIREEVDYLHELSLMLLETRGILPPFYGGEWLEEHKREIVPLWGVLANEEEELGLVLIRARSGVEPNTDLREARRQIGLSNTWPVEKLLESLSPEGKTVPVEGGDTLRGTKIALALFADQCGPAPGLTREGMIEAFSQDKPIALFIHVPIIGDGEVFLYGWSDFEFFRAEVIYADTPEELEMAVWHYRLEMALEDERTAVNSEGANPAEAMMAGDVAELAGIFDVMVMDAMRYYGVTSPVAEKQRALDVLRGLDGDLVVQTPLKPDVEPVRTLASIRTRRIDTTPMPSEVLLRISPESEIMSQVWPQVRAHSHYCMRVRRADLALNRSGQPRVRGFLPTPMIEWIVAESLPALYQKTTFHCMRQMLLTTGWVREAGRLGDSSVQKTVFI